MCSHLVPQEACRMFLVEYCRMFLVEESSLVVIIIVMSSFMIRSKKL